MTGEQAESLVYSYIFRKKKKRKKCPSEIMRMSEKVTFMALRIVERHPSTRQVTDFLYRPKKDIESNSVSTIKSRKEG